jgi:putative effector of murein hydrolase
MILLHHAWNAFCSSPLFGLLGTLLAYEVALALQRRLGGSVLVNPVLLAAAMVVLLLEASGVRYGTYMAGGELVFVLLGPATVALAVPLHNHAVQLRRSAIRLCLAAGVGSAVAGASAVGIAAVLGASDVVPRSIAPKSVTTAIAISLSEQIGGQPGLTAALVVTTGILGGVISGRILDLAGVRSGRARGLAIGVAGHGIGTAYALTESAEAGAYAGAGMAFSGVLTGLLLPTIWGWIMPG